MTARDNSDAKSGEKPANGGNPDHREGQLSPADRQSLDKLVNAVRSGDRNALARAITLVESRLSADRNLALAMVDACIPLAGRSIRLGVSGLPGAGKSTFIDRVGSRMIEEGHRVAVLSVDPSSIRTGGSILGDKTRMENLAREDDAFIRPSSSGGTSGGIGIGTREAILLCEAAGYDVVIVETVGVGQSETEVGQVTDFVLLLLTTGGGDALQGIKRGALETADIVAVSKADGENESRARETADMYRSVINLFYRDQFAPTPTVLPISSFSGTGLAEVWTTIQKFAAETDASGYRGRKRSEQAVRWMHTAIEDELRSRLLGSHDAVRRVSTQEELVRSGKASPLSAAVRLVDDILAGKIGAERELPRST